MRIDRIFLLVAAVCLIAGSILGIYMGLSNDFRLTAAHAHLNLLGWGSCAVFGLVYRSYPELAATWLAKLHLALAAPGAILLVIGIAFSILTGQIPVAVVGALLWLAGSICFLILLLIPRRARTPS